MLKLMYITNDPTVAKIAADAGVDRIFIDMEVLGKAERQGGMDTVQSHHTPEDIAKVRAAIGDQAEIMARVNPMNSNSQTEIDDAIANGADVIMLPMWRTVDDLRQLVRMVNGRAKVMPLLETDTAADNLPEAVKVSGIDQMHIGLNDLHLCYHQKFMFQLLTDGTVDQIGVYLENSGQHGNRLLRRRPARLGDTSGRVYHRRALPSRLAVCHSVPQLLQHGEDDGLGRDTAYLHRGRGGYPPR